MSNASDRQLTIDELADLREKTEVIAKLLRDRLTAQLEALRPLFAPRRLLGRHVRTGSRDEIPGADRVFAQLKERYAVVCGRPYALPKQLEEGPLSIDPALDVYPFEYRHKLASGDRVIAMTNPVCWTLHYRSGYTLTQLEAALENRANLRPSDVQSFLQSSLAMQLLLEHFADIVAVLQELRYEVTVEKRPHLGELPLVTLRAPLAAFRPSDSVISTATRFSGVPAFIELIELDALAQMRDPLRERIESALGLR